MNAGESSAEPPWGAPVAPVQQVIDDCMRRRMRGEALSDEALIAGHPELMPELGRELRKLALIQRAVEEGRSGSSLRWKDPEPATHAPSLDVDAFPGYRVTGEIHRGGQGIVYRAVQTATGRDVAIKVMKEGPFAGPSDRARFDREVHILGRLNHPHIANIHDRGEAHGSFFYTMDYVAGHRLDEYVALESRSAPELLSLFAKICDAVNAAHLRGVIHRDLKPGNIRVDADGEPCVLDFGLAKVATNESEASQMTVTGQFVGTLPWASPEQAAGQADGIDVRTDVYSLGVVLYQMLTGRFPYDITGAMHEVVERIVHAAPLRPGTLRKTIDDEVETIVLKCLAKEPMRRYQTCGELARDVRHYLAGEPIEAKRDSSWYVLKKTVWRYRLPVAAACALGVLLAAGLVVTTALYARARVAEAEATRRFHEVRSLAHTVLFEIHDQIKDLAGATPIRESLVRTALGYLDGLADDAQDDPLLQVELGAAYRLIGNIQGNPFSGPHLGDTAGALASHRRALSLLEGVCAAEPEHGEAQRQLAASHAALADVLVVSGRTAEALAHYDAALALSARRWEADPEGLLSRDDLAQRLRDVGQLLESTGRLDDALKVHRRSLALHEALCAERPDDARQQRDLASGYGRVGALLQELGQYEASLDSLAAAREMLAELVATDPTNAVYRRDLAITHFRVGDALQLADRAAEALASDQAALQAFAELAAADPENMHARRDLIIGHTKVGDRLRAVGQAGPALDAYRAALEISAALAAADPDSVIVQHDLGMTSDRYGDMLLETDQPGAALAAYQRALEIAETLLATDPDSAANQRGLYVAEAKVGDMLVKLGEPAAALEHYQRSRTLREARWALAPESAQLHRDVGMIYASLGAAHGSLAQAARAAGAPAATHWETSRGWLVRALEVFEQMRREGFLAEAEAQVPDELRAAIARCDAGLDAGVDGP